VNSPFRVTCPECNGNGNYGNGNISFTPKGVAGVSSSTCKRCKGDKTLLVVEYNETKDSGQLYEEWKKENQ
jgi:hypothetical protein